MWIRKVATLFIAGIIILSLLSCKKPITNQEGNKNPVNYLFLIDNSGSIPSGESREIAREVLKFFVDFAESGDRVSIVRFDETAGIVASREVNTPEDRSAVKSAIDDRESGINFRGQYTDISKGVQFLRENTNNLFNSGATPVAILISDGKLEPRDHGETRNAFDVVCRLIEGDLNMVPFYTIGIGNTGIYENFLPGINGMAFLKDRISDPTGGHFYHARTVDDLLEIFVNILKASKKAPEIRKGYILDVDNAIERISVIAAKRGSTQQYSTGNDLILTDPQGTEITYNKRPDNVTWHGASPYFDLIIINKPKMGQWRIRGTGNNNQPVVSIMKTWLTLAYDVNTLYYENEQKLISAWVEDNMEGEPSDIPYTMSARFDMEDRFDSSYNFKSFHAAEGHKYSTEIDADAIGAYYVQIVAENKDAFFRRVSEPVRIRVERERTPFLNISKAGPYVNRLGWDGVLLGAEVDRAVLDFERAPDVRFYFTDTGAAIFKGIDTVTLGWKPEGNKISYASQLKLRPGEYRGYYSVAGTLRNGERFTLRSRNYTLFVRWWWLWQLLICLGIALIFLAIGWMARRPERARLPKTELIIVSALLFIGSFVMWDSYKFLPSVTVISAAIIYMILWLLIWKSDRLHPRLAGELIFIKPSGMPAISLKGHEYAMPGRLGRFGQYVDSGSLIPGLKNVSFRLSARRTGGRKVIELERERDVVRVNGRQVTSSDIFHRDRINFRDNSRDYEIEFSNPDIPKI